MISYRKAAIEDIAELTRLRIDFLKEVATIDPGDEGIAGKLEAYFRTHLQQGDYVNWLALNKTQIVATGGICFHTIPPNFVNPSGDRAYILNVYTVPEYRRQGISKKIFEMLMHEASQRNITQVSLHATNDGRALYEQFGFVVKNNEMVWGKNI